jgi:hypothetical protein
MACGTISELFPAFDSETRPCGLPGEGRHSLARLSEKTIPDLARNCRLFSSAAPPDPERSPSEPPRDPINRIPHESAARLHPTAGSGKVTGDVVAECWPLGFAHRNRLRAARMTGSTDETGSRAADQSGCAARGRSACAGGHSSNGRARRREHVRMGWRALRTTRRFRRSRPRRWPIVLHRIQRQRSRFGIRRGGRDRESGRSQPGGR